MRNIKIIVQYDGTRYSGWQSQEHDENTIQGKLTAVLTRLLGEAVELAGPPHRRRRPRSGAGGKF